MLTRLGMSLFAVVPIAAQGAPAAVATPPRVEVLDSSGTPSLMLREQLKKGGDSFVLLDIGVFVDALVVWLRRDWQRLEETRSRSLAVLLAAMGESFAKDGTTTDVAACRSIARVASALLDSRTDEQALPPLVLDELRDVREERTGVLRFLPGERAVDWSIAKPRGAYVGNLGGLFRATLYLRTVLSRIAGTRADTWNAAVEAQQYSDASLGLYRTDSALQLLFGSGEPPMPGLVGLLEPQQCHDLVQLAALREDPRDPWSKLDGVFAIAPAQQRPTSVRHAVLVLANAFATESTDGEFFVPLGPERWRRKWTDCASFAYVGMRELDGISHLAGREVLKQQPRVVVEPAPRSWRALRDFASSCDDVFRASGGLGLARTKQLELDLVLEALAVQQRGEDLAPESEAKLLELLLRKFDAAGGASPVEIDGIRGALRRAGPVLVRVPIRWKGETHHALAFRIYVEHEQANGTLVPPPWGIDLGAVIEPRSAK